MTLRAEMPNAFPFNLIILELPVEGFEKSMLEGGGVQRVKIAPFLGLGLYLLCLWTQLVYCIKSLLSVSKGDCFYVCTIVFSVVSGFLRFLIKKKC